MKDKLEQRFKELEGKFDVEEPMLGHIDRFRVKLSKELAKKPVWNPLTWKWLTVAASILLIIGIWFGNSIQKQTLELADVSPQMEETQSFFISTIKSEIEKINLERNEDNQQIIDDAFSQLNKLEENYKQLTLELQKSDKDKRIIYAMISNFQQRIDVLQNLLAQLNELKQLQKNIDDGKII